MAKQKSGGQPLVLRVRPVQEMLRRGNGTRRRGGIEFGKAWILVTQGAVPGCKRVAEPEMKLIVQDSFLYKQPVVLKDGSWVVTESE